MPRSRWRCHQCLRPSEQVGPISKRGLCDSCAVANIRANTVAVQGRDEAAHDRWRQRWLDGCGHYGRPITPF